ncbi:porin family protein [Pontibacter sp. FD36]|uniref:type IX secretion/gliding motility protein PorT/SprT n=1 Tax=Pontibacter sp. FD36 TaxID=2789860 RepID=UPI001E3B30DD|nr:porin family protein [Pontibacter sp. FD36]
MAFTHIWHQLYLHRQKISFAVLLFVLMAGTTQVQAQNQKVMGENKPGYDEKRIHYGFYLGMSYSKYYIEHSQAYVDQITNGTKVNTMNSLGFYPGLVLNVRLFEYLDARFVPGVGFYGRSIDFERNVEGEEGGNFDNTTFASPVIELPLLLKYRAKRRGNFRMYMVGGVKASRMLGNTTHTQNGNLLQVNRNDLSVEYGVGLDIFYPFFKFAPELRYSHGLMDQKSTAGGEYSPLIDRMTTRNVSLIFHFE